mgnify:CR=1 FL=1
MEQKTITDLEIFNDLLNEIVRLYFLNNSINDILKYLEKEVGSELFEEIKKCFREVSMHG